MLMHMYMQHFSYIHIRTGYREGQVEGDEVFMFTNNPDELQLQTGQLLS